jgi:hypothetical protein
MSIKLNETAGGKVLEVQVGGKLAHADYLLFVPEFERLVSEHGKIRVLFEMLDFHGWETAAVWDDIKFDLKHFTHIERIAMVGDKKWERGMAVFCRPFTIAKLRYFDVRDSDKAREWLEEGLTAHSASTSDGGSKSASA